MPPTTRKKKSSVEEDPTPESVPAPKKVSRPAKRGATRASKGRQDQDEDSVDRGRNGGRNSFELATSSKRARASVSDAKREIRRKADELIQLIENQRQQIVSADDGTFGSDSLESKVAATLPGMTTFESTIRAGPRDSIYHKAHNYIRNTQRVVTEYEILNKSDTNIKKPRGIRWEQDSKDLSELNQKAMAISLRTLNGIILNGVHTDFLAPPANVGDDIEKVAWELLAEGRPKTVEETWGAAAQEMMKSFAGVVKLLPKSD